MRFRTLTMFSVTINDVFWKSLGLVWSALAWIPFSQNITAGRCEAKKYTSPSNRFHGPEIWKSCFSKKYWRWWTVQASKITKFARPKGAGLKSPQRFNISFLLSVSSMCIYMFFCTCSPDSYCANHFGFGVILYVCVAVIVLQIDPCVFRWHVRFVMCIVVSVLCMYLCRLKVLATHTLFCLLYTSPSPRDA